MGPHSKDAAPQERCCIKRCSSKPRDRCKSMHWKHSPKGAVLKGAAPKGAALKSAAPKSATLKVAAPKGAAPKNAALKVQPQKAPHSKPLHSASCLQHPAKNKHPKSPQKIAGAASAAAAGQCKQRHNRDAREGQLQLRLFISRPADQRCQ